MESYIEFSVGDDQHRRSARHPCHIFDLTLDLTKQSYMQSFKRFLKFVNWSSKKKLWIEYADCSVSLESKRVFHNQIFYFYILKCGKKKFDVDNSRNSGSQVSPLNFQNFTIFIDLFKWGIVLYIYSFIYS